MADIVVTLPASVAWEDYSRELNAVSDWSQVMRFKVPTLPKVVPGDRCYLVWRGSVRGWMAVVGVCEEAFKFSTTGRMWTGKFVERSGPFHLSAGPSMKGFQGYRYASRCGL